MRHLRPFNESERILAYDKRVLEILPKEISIYTSNGSFSFKIGNSTIESDVLRVVYGRNTSHSDGEPDSLSLDFHFIKNENGFKTILDIIYGDSVKYQLSIEKPNKIKVGYYNGFRSVIDPDTQFGFEDVSLRNLCTFLNSFNFGYNLRQEDFKSIDKYPDSYKPELMGKIKTSKNGLKNSVNVGDEIILVIDNSKPPENNYLNKILDYLRFRGEKFEVVSSIDELNLIINKYKIVGAISTGSDYRLSISEDGTELCYECYRNLECPILGICFGMQTMVKFYEGTIMDSKKFLHKYLKLSNFEKNHFLFKDFDLQNVEFSFSNHDVIEKMPDGFKQIAMLDELIVGISDSERKRYGLLFHPEDKQMTYPVLDNFIGLCKGGKESDNQKKIQNGQFEKLVTFKNFTK
jgi:GMP synthase-like glutamine amidotransferase